MPRSHSPLTSEFAQRAFLLTELMRSTGEREFPAQLMSVFYFIAAHNGCKQEEVIKGCGLSPSSVSRNVTWLGPQHRFEHRSGLKLVRRERDPNDYKRWRLFLTPKGETFLGLVEGFLSKPLSLITKTKLEANDSDNEDMGSSS